MSEVYDVIIPVARKDANFVPRVVDFVCRCLSGVNTIYIITAKANKCNLSNKLRSFSNCKILDEDKIIPSLSFSIIKQILEERAADTSKTGWYFQQFLKFAFAQSEYVEKYYLSWDADTLPLAPIDFFEDNHILYNPKNEYNLNYFKPIEKLFGYGKVCKHSFISENMLFSVDVVKQMLKEIENSNNKGDNWIEKILYACDLKNPLPAFSEFETYGSYCFVNYPELYKARSLNTFREAGMISGRFISEKRLRYMSFDVDVASFEMMHQPLFPYNIPYYYNRLRSLFSLSPKEALVRIKRFFKTNIEHSDNSDIVEKTIFRLPINREKIKDNVKV